MTPCPICGVGIDDGHNLWTGHIKTCVESRLAQANNDLQKQYAKGYEDGERAERKTRERRLAPLVEVVKLAQELATCEEDMESAIYILVDKAEKIPLDLLHTSSKTCKGGSE